MLVVVWNGDWQRPLGRIQFDPEIADKITDIFQQGHRIHLDAMTDGKTGQVFAWSLSCDPFITPGP